MKREVVSLSGESDSLNEPKNELIRIYHILLDKAPKKAAVLDKIIWRLECFQNRIR